MATLKAGSARRKSTRLARTRRLLIVMVLLLVVLIGAGVVTGIVSLPQKKRNATPLQLTYVQKQSRDVGIVAGAIGQYATANGTLPIHVSVASDGGLLLCGAVCNVSALEVTPTVYAASDIKLVGYEAGLKVSDQHMMYLVPGAKCASDGTVGDSSSVPRSMVLLYAVASSKVVTPRCLTL